MFGQHAVDQERLLRAHTGPRVAGPCMAGQSAARWPANGGCCPAAQVLTVRRICLSIFCRSPSAAWHWCKELRVDSGGPGMMWGPRGDEAVEVSPQAVLCLGRGSATTTADVLWLPCSGVCRLGEARFVPLHACTVSGCTRSGPVGRPRHAAAPSARHGSGMRCA